MAFTASVMMARDIAAARSAAHAEQEDGESGTPA